MTAVVEADVLAYGTPLRLRGGDDRLLQRLLGRLPPSWKPAADGGGRCYVLTRCADPPSLTLTADGGPLAEGSEEHALGAFQDDVDSHVAEHSADRVFVHAGVVEWRGRAIVLPGPSLAGETTLTAALLGAGATYFSDEFAVLDFEGRVHAYPRPLGLRDAATGARTSRSAASLDSAVGVEPGRSRSSPSSATRTACGHGGPGGSPRGTERSSSSRTPCRRAGIQAGPCGCSSASQRTRSSSRPSAARHAASLARSWSLRSMRAPREQSKELERRGATVARIAAGA